MGTFYIENFGCRATQADGAAIERQFLDRGLERASNSRDAKIVVLNTCTVTEGADKDARASIRRLQRENPGCQILVTGCYAQRAPHEIASIPGVTWVVGNSHKHAVASIATASSGFVPLTALADGRAPEVVVGDIFAHTELLAAPVFDAANERTRPNLKVQDGCDNRCSFCVIPSVRGQSRSLPLDRVIREVRTLVQSGYREVVISGINLGRWGRDLTGSPPRSTVDDDFGRPEKLLSSDPRRLPDLVRAILEETSLEKLRISSVEPMDWCDELIELMASSPRIAKHAHVPMQSASDAVLRRMHRKYRPWHYRERILKIRKVMPSAAIGADVMVGFPGETEAEFNATRRMIEELPFTYLHVFTYSSRPGTRAAERADHIPVQIARERNRILRDLAAQKHDDFCRSLLGKQLEAITLRTGSDGFTDALTDNYLKMRLQGSLPANRWTVATVESVGRGVLVGTPGATSLAAREGDTEVTIGAPA